MKNILLLTTEYPNSETRYDTPIVHYFTKEWVKKGYNVKVIHYRSTFPFFYYWIAIIFNKIIKKFFGTDFIPTKRMTKVKISYLDNVKVFSIPIFKILPHSKYFGVTLKNHFNKIIAINNEDGFIPDFIVGHFYNPQLDLISKLKKHYINSTTCIVLHENPIVIKNTHKSSYEELFKNIDIWGFRFKKLQEIFIEQFGSNYNTFICSSGVPAEFIFDKITLKKFDKKITTISFAGMLIPLKRVNDTIIALNESFPDKLFEFNIVGEGMEKERLQKLTRDLNLENNINFLNKRSRTEVQKILNETDLFIMVSESEAFGLVYLEAMSKGCITIGTLGQGIDGTIINGFNGFLCSSNNINELSELIKNIRMMERDELIKISQNAINTALNMTDEIVAENYINYLNSFKLIK